MSMQGNLLDDDELIDVLAVTKRTVGEVKERLAVASETNKKINEACEEFRPVAHRAMILYFLIAEFSTVNTMYQVVPLVTNKIDVILPYCYSGRKTLCFLMLCTLQCALLSDEGL